MEKDAVPQDTSPTYGGLRKLLYAVDESGKYTGVQSSGWEAESFSTELAVSEMNRRRDEAWQRATDGKTAALEYHMYRNRMDFDTLVMVSGLWRWRVRRHFKPAVYAQLSDKVLARYAEAMGVSIAELRQLPNQP
ncbi:MAG: hypothetical protein AB7F79_13175 [Steroidobacteraceae bacterium]